jgi:hypothetical protein
MHNAGGTVGSSGDELSIHLNCFPLPAAVFASSLNRVKLMRSLVAIAFSLVVTLLLSGCFQAEQVINVKPDGSGTVVMTIKVGKEALAQMKAFGGADAKGDPIDQMMKKEEAEEMAKKLGEGVKLEKIETVKEGETQGKRATFSFADINKVRADMNMGPNAGGGDEAKDPITFQMTKGNPASLVINCPAKKPENKPDDPQEDAQMAAAAAMMKDMRITVAVNIVGTIVKTDADNKDGTRITLIDLPVGEALKDVKRFKAIDRAPNWEAAAKMIKEIPGAKVESKEKISVQLK